MASWVSISWQVEENEETAGGLAKLTGSVALGSSRLQVPCSHGIQVPRCITGQIALRNAMDEYWWDKSEKSILADWPANLWRKSLIYTLVAPEWCPKNGGLVQPSNWRWANLRLFQFCGMVWSWNRIAPFCQRRWHRFFMGSSFKSPITAIAVVQGPHNNLCKRSVQ